jgi:hypothetical protein
VERLTHIRTIVVSFGGILTYVFLYAPTDLLRWMYVVILVCWSFFIVYELILVFVAFVELLRLVNAFFCCLWGLVFVLSLYDLKCRSGLGHFPLSYYKSSPRRFIVGGTKALNSQARWTWWFTWFKPPERNTLRPWRGLLYCCVCCSSIGLNLPKRVCLLPLCVRPFIVQARTITLWHRDQQVAPG